MCQHLFSCQSKTAAILPAYPAIVRSQRLLQDFTAFDMDAYVAGKDKKWQFCNCEPSSFPFAYDKVEHLYMLAGKFTIQYDGAEPVTIVAGDFVSAQPACACLLSVKYAYLPWLSTSSCMMLAHAYGCHPCS